jgi:hypothetical protein
MADPTKPYELTFDAREHYLYVHIHADAITRETVLAYLTEIAEECSRLEYRRLMIHREVPVMLSEPDIFFVTNDFLGMVQGVTVAFVNPNITHEAAMRFAILVGTNRGAKFKAFPTVESAEKWLLAGVPNPTPESQPPILAQSKPT